jgi:flagellin-like protein
MRKLLKNKKALSPVVAAIILIAVTVAVSIAVAAWMGSLTIGFMETAELTVVEVAFLDTTTTPATTADSMNVTVTNSGTASVTINQVRVNGNTIATTNWNMETSTSGAIAPGDSDEVQIQTSWVAGNKYSITFFAKDGTMIGSFTDTA